MDQKEFNKTLIFMIKAQQAEIDQLKAIVKNLQTVIKVKIDQDTLKEN